MTFRAIWVAATLVGLSLAGAGLAGCRGGASRAQGSLAIPPDGSIRVLARRIEQTPDRIHWHWSLLGERNWRTPSGTGTALQLSDVYALNDPMQTRGCNTWEVDLAGERTAADPTHLQWTATLHGSNGKTAQTTGTLPLTGTTPTPDAAIEALMDKTEATQALPADLVLARIGDAKLTVQVPK